MLTVNRPFVFLHTLRFTCVKWRISLKLPFLCNVRLFYAKQVTDNSGGRNKAKSRWKPESRTTLEIGVSLFNGGSHGKNYAFTKIA